MYINRHIKKAFKKAEKFYPAILLTGSRQVGKSTFLTHTYKKCDYISFDKWDNLRDIKNNPQEFLLKLKKQLILDEIQRIQDAFIAIKYIIDEYKNKEKILYLLTGSQKFVLMKNVSESLAGRLAILEMYGLSSREIYEDDRNDVFMPKKEYIENAVPKFKYSKNELWNRILRGSYPEIYEKNVNDLQMFYSNIVETYVERDVHEFLNIKDTYTFKKFLVSIAARSGQLLNMSEMGKEIGVDTKTIKSWISVLEASNIIYLLYPFYLNVSKRIVKTPKVYFLDTGLLCYLTDWKDYKTLESGAYSGNIFETFVVSEIIKSFANSGLKPNIYYFRNANTAEIDLLFYEDNTLYPIEIKKSSSPNPNAIKSFHLLKSYYKNVNVGEGGIICSSNGLKKIDSSNYLIPIEYL